MKFLIVVICSVLCGCSLALLVLHIKSKRLFGSLILNAVIGLAAVAAVNLTQSLTGVSIPVNWYTVGGSAVFGIPAVCGIIVLQMLI